MSVLLASTVFVSSAPMAYAKPKVMYECVNHSHVWDKRQCPEFNSGPAGFPGGGGGNGGLLGALGDLVGGIL